MNTNMKPNETQTNESYVIPPVNIAETKDAILVEAEMPGVDKSRLEVSVDGDDLVIVGRRHPNGEQGEAVWREIPRFDFRRAFTLGDHINRQDIKAAFDNGVLTLRLGKAEDVKPRKIEVEFN